MADAFRVFYALYSYNIHPAFAFIPNFFLSVLHAIIYFESLFLQYLHTKPHYFDFLHFAGIFFSEFTFLALAKCSLILYSRYQKKKAVRAAHTQEEYS